MKNNSLFRPLMLGSFLFSISANKIEAAVAGSKTQVVANKTNVDKPSKNMGNEAIEKPMGAIVVKNEVPFFPGGCGFRKALGGLVKVYEICFFGKNMKASEWKEVFASKDKAYKLKLSFLRGVGGKKVTAAFSEGLAKTPASQKLEEMERQKFLAWSAALKIEKNSILELSINDGNSLKASFIEKEGAAPLNYESSQNGLATAMTAIWLGESPISDEIKEAILSK